MGVIHAMDSDPYRASNPQAPIPPQVRTPFMWGFRVWWSLGKVQHSTGEPWKFAFWDASGTQQCYRLNWGPSIERVALICENTPAGQSAAIPYEERTTHHEMMDADDDQEFDTHREVMSLPPRPRVVGSPPGGHRGVDFIPPAQVPTLGRYAREVWESYRRSRANDPAKYRP